MPKSLIREFENVALLDIRSFGRRGPGQRDRISPAEHEIVRRTLRRDPEVMVKVLTQGAHNLMAVGQHLDYIGREGEVAWLTDDGREIGADQDATQMLQDWNLDLEAHRPGSRLEATRRARPPKLVHKLMFSMPVGTPPEKVLTAVQHFAREEFGFEHRYLMSLHTDEPHPHVHVVVKAMSEQGVRLNIHKAKLRMWRSEFARQLREQGVRANATDRLVRGCAGRSQPDGVYRADRRGALRRVVRDPSKATGSRQALLDIQAGWAVVGQLVELGETRNRQQKSRTQGYDLTR